MIFNVDILQNGVKKQWTFNGNTLIVKDENEQIIGESKYSKGRKLDYYNFSEFNNKNFNPNKIESISLVMGPKCNYNCSYCSGDSIKTVGHDASPKDIDSFIEKLKKLIANPKKIKNITFWGGEPLVYWKTIVPLVPKIKELFPKIHFSVVTNGSLIDEEKINFFSKYNFHVQVSDDINNIERGKEATENINEHFEIYKKLLTNENISFNIHSVINKNNCDVFSDYLYIEKKLKNLYKKDDLIFSFSSCRSISVPTLRDKVSHYIFSNSELNFFHDSCVKLFEHLYYKHWGSSYKAAFEGMFLKDTNIGGRDISCGVSIGTDLAVNMNGDVLLCEVMSYPYAGNIENPKSIKLYGHTMGKDRDNCPKCPFYNYCRVCNVLDNAAVNTTCPQYYAQHYAVFKVIFERLYGVKVTGIRCSNGYSFPAMDFFNNHVEDYENSKKEYMKEHKKIIPILNSLNIKV